MSDVAKRTALYWELLGLLVVFASGFAIHVVAHTGEPTAVTAGLLPVNESVWEHLKMGFWPVIPLAVVQYRWLSESGNNFVVAKGASGLANVTVVAVAMVVYNTLSSQTVLLDPLTFLFACVVGQAVSFLILTRGPLGDRPRKVVVALILLVGVSFYVFVYVTPPLWLFQDLVTGGYGPR